MSDRPHSCSYLDMADHILSSNYSPFQLFQVSILSSILNEYFLFLPKFLFQMTDKSSQVWPQNLPLLSFHNDLIPQKPSFEYINPHMNQFITDEQQIQHKESEKKIKQEQNIKERQQFLEQKWDEKRRLFERWVEKNPKTKLISELKKIGSSSLKKNGKIKQIYSHLRPYLFNYEQQYYDSIFRGLNVNPEQLITGIKKGLRKKVGNLDFTMRRKKIVLYLKKKEFRQWRKRINYDIRKVYAQNRLRIKGKFVSQLSLTD